MMFSRIFLASRLKELRNGLTQVQAAQKVGLSQQGWARYELGKVVPGAEAIHQICVSFGVSADWLLGLSDHSDGGGTATAHGVGAIAAAGNATVNAGGDCSKCRLMQAHIREITGRR